MIFYSGLYKAIRSREGFTVIEVLVSLSIFSVAVLGLAVGAITIVRANKTSQFHTVATNLAQDRLEQMKAASTANLATCTAACDATPPTYQGVVFTRNWNVALNTPAQGVHQVSVTVGWTDYAAQTLTISSWVLQNPQM